MRKYLLFVFLFTTSVSFGQGILDYKIKNASNAKDRTAILDVYREYLYRQYKQEFVFVVKHFKIGNNFGWLMADLKRKDGGSLVLPSDEGESDCCHVEALFRRTNGRWIIVEHMEFSNDIWWQGIGRRYPTAPPAIFDEFGR